MRSGEGFYAGQRRRVEIPVGMVKVEMEEAVLLNLFRRRRRHIVAVDLCQPCVRIDDAHEYTVFKPYGRAITEFLFTVERTQLLSEEVGDVF